MCAPSRSFSLYSCADCYQDEPGAVNVECVAVGIRSQDSGIRMPESRFRLLPRGDFDGIQTLRNVGTEVEVKVVTGTLVNTAAVVAGSLLGVVIGRRLPDRVKTIVMQALGLSVILVGLQMALSGTRPLLAIGSLLLGAVTGEMLDIEGKVAVIGEWLKRRFRSESSSFVQGFVTASVLYCTGAMVIVGSIRDGTVGDASILYVKSLLDGVASIAFASSFGIGVAFSALSVFVVQGAITLLASQLVFLQNPGVIEAVTATGGLLILGIGFNILEIKQMRVGNLVPALVYAILAALYIP